MPPPAWTATAVGLFHIVQTAPAELAVRLQPTPGADPEHTWTAVHREPTDLLTTSGLGHVTVRRSGQGSQPATGGKYRLVQPLAQAPG